MGIFSSSPPPQTSPSAPTPSSDGAYIAPDRSARQHCWDARDTFFTCLERNGIVNSIEEKEKTNELCGKENQRLEGECVKSWVQHLNVQGFEVQADDDTFDEGHILQATTSHGDSKSGDTRSVKERGCSTHAGWYGTAERSGEESLTRHYTQDFR